MRFSPCFVLSLALLGSPLSVFAQKDAPPAAGLAADDRARAVKYLEETKAALLAAVANLSDAQWRFKPAPDRWSVAETAEHIAIAEAALFGVVTDKVMKTPAEAPKPAEAKALDEMIVKGLTSREKKFKAPEGFQPTGRWPTRDGLVKAFEESRGRTIEYVKMTTDDLRSHFMDSPVIKNMDAFQWILFLTAHSERHTKQILEVKADPAFPKS